MSQPNRPIKPSVGSTNSSRPQPVKATQPFTLRQPSPTKNQATASTTSSTKKSPRSSPSLFTPDRFSPRGRLPADSRSSPERRSPVAAVQSHLASNRDRSRPGLSQRVTSPGNNTSLPRTGSLDTLCVSGGRCSSPAVQLVTPRVVNKSTQTSPEDLVEMPQLHKRSNSLGSADYREKLRQNCQRERHSTITPVQGNHQSLQLPPLSRQSPIISVPMQYLGKNMRCSLEGLNKEVENLVSSFNDMKNRPLTPDGRKPPVMPILRRQHSVDVETQTRLQDLSLDAGSDFDYGISMGISPVTLTIQQSSVSSPLSLGRSESVGNESPEQSVSYGKLPPASPKCSFARDPPIGLERVVMIQEFRRATTTTCFVEEGPDPSKVGFVLKSDDSTPFLRIPAKRPIGPVVKGPLTNKSVSPQATAVSQ